VPWAVNIMHQNLKYVYNYALVNWILFPKIRCDHIAYLSVRSYMRATMVVDPAQMPTLIVPCT
jgi:hypothetical protein